ncbi:MAG TPA: alpha/beta fold hydrolase [Steroidobacteraceae bacterium]
MATTAKLVMEEFMIPAADAGVELYVRNKHERERSSFASDHILLYVHGATYPAETTFDLQLNGLSWMDYIARRGYDVYLVDVRGYGRSTRPAEMSAPAGAHAPLVRTDTALRDFAAAVDFVLERRGVEKINLLAWSWGTSIAGAFTSANNDKVNRLALYAPLWNMPRSSLLESGPLGAYRVVSREAATRRWFAGVPEAARAGLIPAGWFDAWAEATFATDPVGAASTPPVLRVPNGALQDALEIWAAGKAAYDPAAIRVPTLLVHGQWDADLPSSVLHALFAQLTRAPCRRCVEIGEGTHSLMMERHRLQLFRTVQHFLDEELDAGQ